jgi:hypothetical protein
LAIIRKRYWDFGPTLAAEKLREVHGIVLGRETLRLWMIDAGIWTDRKQRRKRVHQPRDRRECVGELVQIDGCEHWWFEDRGPQCTLLVFIDDATSRLPKVAFAPVQPTDGDGCVGAALSHIGGKSPVRSPIETSPAGAALRAAL